MSEHTDASASKAAREASNKERFERLKESRQKYKDEAASARARADALEAQLAMMSQMHEMGGGGGGGSDDKAAAAAAAEKALENSKEETKRAIEEGNKVRAALASAAAATHRATRECETLKKEVQSVKEDAAKEVGKYRSVAEKARFDGGSGGGRGGGRGGGWTDFDHFMWGVTLGSALATGVAYLSFEYMMRKR